MFLFIFIITLNRIGRQYYYLTFTDEETEIWTMSGNGSKGNSFLIEKVWLPKWKWLPKWLLPLHYIFILNSLNIL